MLSKKPGAPTEIRHIEVKGRARLGAISLSGNEYKTAFRLGKDYWLYVVFNCAAKPELYAINDPARLRWEPMQEVIQYRISSEAVMDEASRQAGPLSRVEQAFRSVWQSRLADLGQYNILVEGISDKVYLELAAELHQKAAGVDLLDGDKIRIIAGKGTKKFAPDFGLLQSLEKEGIKFVVILDGDDAGKLAADAMKRFGAQKNRHYFQLARDDYKDKGGKSWDVEIEDLLPWHLLESYIQQYPEAVEERFQRGAIQKVVIQGKPVTRDGQRFDYKMMLTEYIRQRANAGDMATLIDLLKKARKFMGVK